MQLLRCLFGFKPTSPSVCVVNKLRSVSSESAAGAQREGKSCSMCGCVWEGGSVGVCISLDTLLFSPLLFAFLLRLSSAEHISGSSICQQFSCCVTLFIFCRNF